jgi:hypothetical protein
VSPGPRSEQQHDAEEEEQVGRVEDPPEEGARDQEIADVAQRQPVNRVAQHPGEQQAAADDIERPPAAPVPGGDPGAQAEREEAVEGAGEAGRGRSLAKLAWAP